MLSPITKRVDHIMIRVAESAYDQLFALLTETFQLPITWPINTYIPSFKTGGVFVGNISMEIFQSGSRQTLSTPAPSLAQLYGIAFEPFSLSESQRALDSRNIPHSTLIPVPPDKPDTMGALWTLLYITNLLPYYPSQITSSTEPANDRDVDLAPMFDQVYPHGMIFFCEYNAQFYDTTQGRLRLQAELRARQGGPLRLEGVQEIIVGTKDFETAQRNWQQLFSPMAPISPGLWQIGDGPAIRLIPHTQDGLVSLIWKVTSLEHARTFLSEQGMLGTFTEQQLSLALTKIFGLDIQLIE
jgi:hypothetical protein